MEGEKTVSEQAEFTGADEEYRVLARRYYHDEGVIEIDDNALIAKGADCGAYVEAWVWVDNPNWGDPSEGHPPPQATAEEGT